MLEIQRIKCHTISRMKARGATDEEIKAVKAAGQRPFKPAFKNGKRFNDNDPEVADAQGEASSEVAPEQPLGDKE